MNYPIAIDIWKVWTYDVLANSWWWYFYDYVLEYRVWMHPELWWADLHWWEDYLYCFSNYEEAYDFSMKTKWAEKPLVLVYQKEHINNPDNWIYEHIKIPRITEWLPEWLEGSKREDGAIERFLMNVSK